MNRTFVVFAKIGAIAVLCISLSGCSFLCALIVALCPDCDSPCTINPLAESQDMTAQLTGLHLANRRRVTPPIPSILPGTPCTDPNQAASASCTGSLLENKPLGGRP